HAGVAMTAGSRGGSVSAVQASGQDLGHARLARPARADEQVRVMNLALRDGVLERAHDVLLPHDVGERARAVAAIKGRAGRHGTSSLVVAAAPTHRAAQGLADPEHPSFAITQSWR